MICDIVTFTTTTSYDAAGQLSGYTYPDGTAFGRTCADRGQLATLLYDSTTIDARSDDDGGRMTSSVYDNGVNETGSYNSDNTLASISYSGAWIGTLRYGWDENKNKTSESISAMVYVQSGQQTIADYGSGVAASSPTYNYVYASYIDEPVLRDDGTNLRYFHRNQQYSITALTDASGSIVERYAYTAYGQPTFVDASGTVLTSSAEDNRYTDTGREWDEALGLYHYRARMYDAAEGRFLGRDPIGFGGGTVNLYEYVGSQPQKWVDPTGLQLLFRTSENAFL